MSLIDAVSIAVAGAIGALLFYVVITIVAKARRKRAAKETLEEMRSLGFDSPTTRL